MPALTKDQACEKLAKAVEVAKASILTEIHAELFPEVPSLAPPVAADIARYIREGPEAEEIVDLWNVVFPEDRNVWYDEGAKAIHYNEEMVASPD